MLFGLALGACGPAITGGGEGRDGGSGDGGPGDGLVVSPDTLQTLTVQRGQTSPTVSFTASRNGQPVPVSWSIDRGDLGAIAAGPSASTVVSPTGLVGGMLTVRARLGSTTVQRKVFIQLQGGSQNGVDPSKPGEQKQIPSGVADLKNGGGVGGVGGEGLGPAVTDPATMNAFATPTGNGQAQSLKLLYPYDGTVWPRGMLAPLLMWSWSQGDADAVQIELATMSGSFTWKGTFARPTILANTGGPFIRHPIPQDVWAAATDSAGGPTPAGGPDQLTVKITLARNGQAFGPITQTWTVAPGRLTGTVYYNSYGTRLVKNWTSTDKAGNPVGAAILGIRSGDTGPKLVIGRDSPADMNGIPTNNSGCRVCHIVASRGRYLIAQAESNGNNKDTYLYNLNAADVQGSAQKLAPDGTFAWAAMLGDGSYALTNAVDPSSTNPAISGGTDSTATSALWQMSGPPVIQPPLPVSIAAGYPSFSPDDTKIAFVDVTGHNADIKDRPLMLAIFDPMTRVFSGLKTIYTPPTDLRVGYPAFLPDGSGVVFEREVRAGGDTVMTTRGCARSELWWTQLGADMPVALRNVNGLGAAAPYLPTGGKNHGVAETGDPQCSADESGFDDTSLAYEPTVLPIVAGGYAWVVFTSRRLYGNQLTQFPWNTWPPDYDTTSLAEAPVKKLWVAAIDLNAPAGTDPSHPAFYLPAQELLAGNSRGFWVLDPCRADGQSCESGDQCCNGFCQPDPAKPASLVCANTAACAGVQEKCSTAVDCCDSSNSCVNGFCAAITVQ